MKKQIILCLSLLLLLTLFSSCADGKSYKAADQQTADDAAAETVLPSYLTKTKAPAKSPLSFSVLFLSGTSPEKEQTVSMRPGLSGKVTTSEGQMFMKWYMDENGYFTISFELPGNYRFHFTSVEDENRTATFGGTIIGAGGGGGGALYSPAQSVGGGGGGGEVAVKDWSEFEKGWRICDFMSPATIRVGEGGEPARQFRFCLCGGEKCPIGSPKEFPCAYNSNDGSPGESSVFAEITAAGGAGGIGGACSGSRSCEMSASDGSSSPNAGTYVFWGVAYECGYGGGGGSFGGDDGPGGDETYFHDGELSFGTSGAVLAGRGNGGGGSGYSYTYGHGMFSGTGTGEGRGSYSTVHFSTGAKGGSSPTYNGYIYLEGRVKVEKSEEAMPVKERHQLVATVRPAETDPIPIIEWSTTNASVAKVGPNGIVSIMGDGEATITATAVQYGIQGYFQIGKGNASALFTVAPDRPLKRPGDKATMVAALKTSLKTDPEPFVPSEASSGVSIVPNEAGTVSVFWGSTNESVARIDQFSGEVEILRAGTAVITATLADATQASYVVEIH